MAKALGVSIEELTSSGGFEQAQVLAKMMHIIVFVFRKTTQKRHFLFAQFSPVSAQASVPQSICPFLQELCPIPIELSDAEGRSILLDVLARGQVRSFDTGNGDHDLILSIIDNHPTTPPQP